MLSAGLGVISDRPGSGKCQRALDWLAQPGNSGGDALGFIPRLKLEPRFIRLRAHYPR